MKTLISKIRYLLFFITIIGFVSCVGKIGPAGPAGTNGVDGVDGVDGNANVQTYIFNNPVWTSSKYWMDIVMHDVLTDSCIKKNVILGYIKTSGNYLVNSLPGVCYGDKDYKVHIFGAATNAYRIVSYELDGTPTPLVNLRTIDWVKLIIIPSTNLTEIEGNVGKYSDPKMQIYAELEEAGVDVNNYYEVADYYGLSY